MRIQTSLLVGCLSAILPLRSLSTAPHSSASNSMETLRVKKLTEFATLPVRGSEHAAGFDLFAAADGHVPSRGKALIMTDISIQIPLGTYARVAPRSGLTWKNSIDTGAGVIDYDYRGNVGVILFNHGPNDFDVKRGDRIAQLILERISMAGIEEVEELDITERGAGGFGSTGENILKKVKTAIEPADN